MPADDKSVINILNSNGNVLMSATAASATYNFNIAPSHSGVYNLVVTTKNKVITLRFVKE